MATHEEVVDCPTVWVNRHIQTYVESGGQRGHRWNGVPTLLLITRGRKSGKLRRTALIYGRDEHSYVVVASIGGAPKHPSWYLNLEADPQVRIQVGPEEMTGQARIPTGSERERLWQQMAEIWPQYDQYQKKTRREIPVVVLDPT